VLVALVAAPGATARFGSGGNASADNPALVSLASVSNGCGGGVASSDARFADEWEFGAWRVNFREACNVHDACYSGTVVADPFASRPGQVVDFRTWSQERCDDAFLANMRTLCRRQISGASPRVHSQMLDARNDCMFGEGRFQPSCSTFYSVVPQVGGFSKIGALLAYKLVRKCGHQYYRQRADLNGNWVNRGSESSVRTASILQVGRAIAVSWTGGTKLCGLGTGTLISRDQNEEVVGDATVTGFANGDFHGTLRIVVNKDGSITFPSLPGSPTLHQGPGRSTQATAPKCSTPAAKPKTSTTATSGTTFTLVDVKVKLLTGPELTVDGPGGKATWDHTGQYGGAGKGGEWKIEYTWKVPKTLTAGKAASVSLALKALMVEPPQPLFVQMSALAPDFRQDLSINYPNPAQAAKTYSVPISSGYATAKDLWMLISLGGAEITYTYRRTGS
jgi:hypothetical protein